MLSSRISSADEEEGESTTPGDYESWSGTASRVTPRTPVTSQQTTVPPISRASSRSPRATNLPTQPKFWPPDSSPDRSRRTRSSRRRSKTPEIAIERKQHHHHHHHHHRHHRSSEPDRLIRIPLDNYPILNMRGPPRQVLEIERVRCRRRRKHRPCCRKVDYNIPPPSLPVSYLQPQSNIIYTNPLPPLYSLPPPPPTLPVSYLQPQSNTIYTNPLPPLYSLPPPLPPPSPLILSTNSNPPPSWSSMFSHLTPQMIENLPRKIVHLPPIYIPSSPVDPNTDLDTVIFPAEMINPIDGTLSIIQSNSTLNSVGTTFTQSPPISPVQSHFISAPTTTVHSPTAMISRSSGPFMQQVQDLFQRITLSQPQSMLSPYNQRITQPVLPQYTTAMNSLYNPQIILPSDTTNIGPYPPANIQPIVAQNSGPYSTTTFTPNYLSNTRPYPPANITPYRSSTDAQYNSLNNRAYQSTDIGPYSPANITPYASWNASNNIPSNQTISNIPPYTSNIDPYSRRVDQSNDFSILPPPIPTPSMPYNEFTPFVSSTSFNSASSALNDHSLSIQPTSSQSTQTPYQSSAMTTTKSILRNGSSNRPSSTIYTRLNPPNVFSSNVVTRELATVV